MSKKIREVLEDFYLVAWRHGNSNNKALKKSVHDYATNTIKDLTAIFNEYVGDDIPHVLRPTPIERYNEGYNQAKSEIRKRLEERLK